MLRVLALSTLFPNAARPLVGGFVEQSMLRLAARDDVWLTMVAPVGVPPWPIARHPAYADLAGVPAAETWKGLQVLRPRFPLIPRVGWRLNPALIAHAVRAVLPAGAFDVIHADFFFPDGPAADILARRLQLPLSIKARGSDIAFWGRRPPVRAAMLRAAARAGGVLAVSESLRTEMAALGMNEGKIAVHRTGVDLARFAPALDRAALRTQFGLPGPLVLSVGHLVPLKRFDIVARAVAALPGVHLRIVGEGPERPRLEALIAASGAADRIALMGARAPGEVARLLAAADVLAMASEREGLANAWVEALACGTPLVITDAGGAREVVDRPAAGRIAERTPAALAAALKTVLAAPPAAAAVRAAAERFSWDRHVEQLHAHLSRVAAGVTAPS